MDFQTWHQIGWQQSRQPIRGHVRKSVLTNMEFNMIILLRNLGSWSCYFFGMVPVKQPKVTGTEINFIDIEQFFAPSHET